MGSDPRLTDWPFIEEVLPHLRRERSVEITGLPGGGKAFFLLAFFRALLPPSSTLLVLTASEPEMEGLLEDLETLLPLSISVPEFKVRSSSAAQAPRLLLFPEHPTMDRLTCLGALAQRHPTIIVTTPSALAKGTLRPEELTQRAVWLRPGTSYPRTQLLNQLAVGGYHRTDFVEGEGEMAVRGEVIDLWPPDQLQPLRLLFANDTLEAIKPFDVGSQRTERFLDEHWLLPVSEEPRTGQLTDFLPSEAVWFLDDLEAEAELPSLDRWEVIRYSPLPQSLPPPSHSAPPLTPTLPPLRGARGTKKVSPLPWRERGG